VKPSSLFVLILSICIASCGGGGSSSSDGSIPNSISSSGDTGSGGTGTADTTSPTISITSPTSASTYTAAATTITLAGVATDNVGVTQVNWSNTTTGSAGTATGTDTWTTGNIGLQNGTNTITVTARDAAGNSRSDSLAVTYNAPDTTPPTVVSSTPVANATNVSVGTTISVTFSEAMNSASITSATFRINGVTGTVAASGTGATFTPASPLSSSSTYTAIITGGVNGVRDAAGNNLPADFSWTFTTSAPIACAASNVLCVDDTPGATQEYSSIQAAVNAARPGDTVLVYDGSYQGFRVAASGTSSSRITIMAQGGSALISQANSSGEGVTISKANYVTIDGFKISAMSGYGLATHDAGPTTPMRGLIIRNNVVQNSGSTNIYLSEVADSLVEGNSASGSATSHGIYLANGGSDNTVLKSNRCFSNAKNGIHLNGDASIGGDGLHTGITIDGNFVFGNTGNGLDIDGMQDSVIRNNLVYGNGRNALRVFQIDAAAGPKNLKVVNNTLLTTSGSGWALKFSEDSGGHTIFNNILLSNNASTGSISVANGSIVSDHNALVGRLSYNGEANIVDLAAWQASGYDQHSVATSTSAEFVDVAGNNFQLKSSAKSVNSGTSSVNGFAAPTKDLLDSGRPAGGAYDLGAYESGY
jgi:hypothetical protein